MNLPVYWGAIAVPAKQIVHQTGIVAANTSQLFGNLLRAEQKTSDNGRSEVASSPTLKKNPDTNSAQEWERRLQSIQQRLGTLLNRSKSEFGLTSVQYDASEYSIALEIDSPPVVRGPEPLRSDVENAIRSDRSLMEELQSAVAERLQSLRSFSGSRVSEPANQRWNIGFSEKPKLPSPM